MTRRWTVLLVALVALFTAGRLAHELLPQSTASHVAPSRVVLVGVTGRYALTAADRAVLSRFNARAQVGAVSIRTRYRGDCAASGWATLGAGRATSVAGWCHPRVRQLHVLDWTTTVMTAAARNPDVHPGTLAASVPGCIAAVGTGAALAAARPDGSLAQFRTVASFLSGGSHSSCPLTLVDAGVRSDEVLSQLAKRSDATVILTGVGPAAGADDPGLQAIYRLGATPPGWLSSASTRRLGVVTLADLTRTLIDAERPPGAPAISPLDGAPLRVVPASLSAADEKLFLDSLAATSPAVRWGDVSVGIGEGILLIFVAVAATTRKLAGVRFALAASVTVPAAMTLTGAVPWQWAKWPTLALCLLVATWAVVLTWLALSLTQTFGIPVAIAGAGLVVVVFSVDAAAGGLMQRGSLLNPQPLDGARWYGIGNVTFAAYASSALVVVGYVVQRYRRSGHPRVGLAVAALVGLGILLCEGWPSMGADFGGVLALTPPMLWLLLARGRHRTSWRTLLLVGMAGVVAVAGISWLDWLRGPDARSHLGNFVQRLIEGGSGALLLRKGAAAAGSVTNPWGLTLLLVGVVLWVVIFNRVLRHPVDGFVTVRDVAVAVLATSILGSVVNDSGVSVWATATGSFFLTTVALRLLQGAERSGLPAAEGRGPIPSP